MAPDGWPTGTLVHPSNRNRWSHCCPLPPDRRGRDRARQVQGAWDTPQGQGVPRGDDRSRGVRSIVLEREALHTVWFVRITKATAPLSMPIPCLTVGALIHSSASTPSGWLHSCQPLSAGSQSPVGWQPTGRLCLHHLRHRPNPFRPFSQAANWHSEPEAVLALGHGRFIRFHVYYPSTGPSMGEGQSQGTGLGPVEPPHRATPTPTARSDEAQLQADRQWRGWWQTPYPALPTRPTVRSELVRGKVCTAGAGGGGGGGW